MSKVFVFWRCLTKRLSKGFYLNYVFSFKLALIYWIFFYFYSRIFPSSSKLPLLTMWFIFDFSLISNRFSSAFNFLSIFLISLNYSIFLSCSLSSLNLLAYSSFFLKIFRPLISCCSLWIFLTKLIALFLS